MNAVLSLLQVEKNETIMFFPFYIQSNNALTFEVRIIFNVLYDFLQELYFLL